MSDHLGYERGEARPEDSTNVAAEGKRLLDAGYKFVDGGMKMVPGW